MTEETTSSADAPDHGDASGASSASDSTEAEAVQASPAEGASRRDFLKLGGAAAAGAVVGAGAGASAGLAVGHARGFAEGSDEFAALTPREQAGFDHLVVVMGENRSFDNLLGWLYTPDDVPAAGFDGLAFGTYSNTGLDGTEVPVHVYEGTTDEIMGKPNPDPGEEFPHVNTQLFGIVDPSTNSEVEVGDMDAPYNAPKPGQKPTMKGFLDDYVINYERLKKGKQPTADEANQIMGSFSPEMLPVLSTLAKNFAVYDAWHCGVPSQTFCNRSFFHASTSHGFVTNKHGGGYRKWIDADPTPTVFNRLEEAGVSWRIYFDELQLVSFTGVLHAPVLEPYWRTERFATMEQFYDDVRTGRLPAYAFIEPRMVYNHNDFHPPFGKLRESDFDGTEIIDSAVSDVRAGELLIHRIYEAVKTSASSGGSNALNTLLLITFDEHGGTYDHVPPPVATPPHEDEDPGEMGFTFDRLGCRVPAIAVSAYTRAGTVVHDEMHHAAVIATLARLHGLKPLTRRDAGANNLFNAVNLDAPRHPSTWPSTTPQYLPPNPQATPPHPAHVHKDKPLSPPARGLLGMLLARFGQADEPEPETYADAYRLLHKYGDGLFGVQG
ncbi:alkaline phosphatase family protein [Agromyces sp. Leaf222]|uniref:alkaline phosphatase family protein n=1 Tax=Agromyces sp. Leaf222 TaxID=1735688 RepID=UPI0009EAC74A|nr:alkaline phosphatase family protein [Agromyces sp. Leaf222]